METINSRVDKAGSIAHSQLVTSISSLGHEEKTDVNDHREQVKDEGYSRASLYVVLIVVWAIIIIAYIVVLEKAVQSHDYLGVRGSTRRTVSFNVLSFIRTGFASVHIPIIVLILASTIPYWTAIKHDIKNTKHTVSSSYAPLPQAEVRSSVAQLFYLADRSWAGFIGWITTSYMSLRLRRPSLIWLHLAVIVAVAYVDFPLLSLAYVVEPSQYWDTLQVQAASTIGSSSTSFDSMLETLSNPGLWVRDGDFSAAPGHVIDVRSLAAFNSSSSINIPAHGGLGSYSGL